MKEERKACEGNDVEMMSIGSALRLEHLEEQPLRTKKATNGSAAKPPKFTHKIIKTSATLNTSSCADDTTCGGHSSGLESQNTQNDTQDLFSSSSGSNGPLQN